MTVRQPAVAGHFYPSSPEACRAEVRAYLARSESDEFYPEAAGLRSGLEAGTERLVGGIVPHAGWICSGSIAAEVLQELARRAGIETFVIFGAAHRLASDTAALYGRAAWATPLGEIAIDEDLASAVLSASSDVEENDRPHFVEHSIEVQLPFVQHLAPAARLLPILVPHMASGPAIGLAVAEQARLLEREVVFVGSTDLTHYGPRYGFSPKGKGLAGLKWAKGVNDRRMIELICRMEADQIAPQARQHQNACGSGAVAATIAACRRWGATRGVLLRHATSKEVLADRYGEMADAVGYAGIVFSRPVGK
jgi:AmmeMemoRadiSam system protein B